MGASHSSRGGCHSSYNRGGSSQKPFDSSNFASYNGNSPAAYGSYGGGGCHPRKRARAERRVERRMDRFERRYGGTPTLAPPVTHIAPEKPRDPYTSSYPSDHAHHPPPYEHGGFVHKPNNPDAFIPGQDSNAPKFGYAGLSPPPRGDRGPGGFLGSSDAYGETESSGKGPGGFVGTF